MRQLKKIAISKVLCSVMGFGIGTFSFSQGGESQERHPNTQNFANEVFRDCPQYLQEPYLLLYSDHISRVKIERLKHNQSKEMLLLSGIGLKNKCNPTMNRDEINFDSNRFNPLKYFFDFYSDQHQFIRVDNTDYVIHILPKKP